jgi:hypothetical protein
MYLLFMHMCSIAVKNKLYYKVLLDFKEQPTFTVVLLLIILPFLKQDP